MLHTCEPLLRNEATIFMAGKSCEERRIAQKVLTYPVIDPDLWLWILGEFDIDKIARHYHDRK